MDKKELGRQVRRARTAKRPKVRQVDLAAAVGVSEGTIQNLERGVRDTHPDTIIAVRQFLEMEGDETETREKWPTDIQVIVDMIGQWLSHKDPQERVAFSREMTRRIVPEE